VIPKSKVDSKKPKSPSQPKHIGNKPDKKAKSEPKKLLGKRGADSKLAKVTVKKQKK